MRFGESTLPKQRGRDRNLRFFCQFTQGILRARNHDAVSNQEERFLRFADCLRNISNMFGVDFVVLVRLITGNIHLSVQIDRHWPGTHIFGNINQNRTRPPGRGDMKRLADRTRNVVGRIQQIAVLHNRHADIKNIGFLEGVFSDHPRNGLTGQANHRDRIHMSSHDPRNNIGGAGTASDKNNSGLAGGTSIAISHMSRALLMTNQNELYIRRSGHHCIENRNNRTA